MVLWVSMASNLHVKGNLNLYCVTNKATFEYSDVVLQVLNMYGEPEFGFYYGSLRPGETKCQYHSLGAVTAYGHGGVRAQGTAPDGTRVSSLHQRLYLARPYDPGYRVEKKKLYYIYGLADGVFYGGYYRADAFSMPGRSDPGPFIPKPQDIDVFVIEDVETGEVAVLTGDELKAGVPPKFVKGGVYRISIEYVFNSKEDLWRYIQSISPPLEEIVYLDKLSLDHKINLALPYLNLSYQMERAATSVERTGDTKLKYNLLINVKGPPFWVVLLIAVASIGVWELYLREKIFGKQEVQREVIILQPQILVPLKGNDIDAVNAARDIGHAIINLLPEGFLKVPPEVAHKIIDDIANRAIKNIEDRYNMIEAAAKAAAEKKEPEISFWDKLKYGLLGAGAAVLLARGAPVVMPYVIERVERARRGE